MCLQLDISVRTGRARTCRYLGPKCYSYTKTLQPEGTLSAVGQTTTPPPSAYRQDPLENKHALIQAPTAYEARDWTDFNMMDTFEESATGQRVTVLIILHI